MRFWKIRKLVDVSPILHASLMNGAWPGKNQFDQLFLFNLEISRWPLATDCHRCCTASKYVCKIINKHVDSKQACKAHNMWNTNISDIKSLWEGGHPVLQTVGLNVARVCRPGVASASDQVRDDHGVTIISWCYWRCWFCRRPPCLRLPVCSSWSTWGEWSLLQVPSTPLIYTPSPSPSLILTLIFLSWCRYFCHFLPQHHQPSLLQHWLPSGLPGLSLVPLGHIFLPVRPAPHKHD